MVRAPRRWRSYFSQWSDLPVNERRVPPFVRVPPVVRKRPEIELDSAQVAAKTESSASSDPVIETVAALIDQLESQPPIETDDKPDRGSVVERRHPRIEEVEAQPEYPTSAEATTDLDHPTTVGIEAESLDVSVDLPDFTTSDTREIEMSTPGELAESEAENVVAAKDISAAEPDSGESLSDSLLPANDSEPQYQPPIRERREGTHIHVIGCGQCGSQIAATIAYSDLTSPDEESDVEIVAAAFDTDKTTYQLLASHWNWPSDADPFILPTQNAERVASFEGYSNSDVNEVDFDGVDTLGKTTALSSFENPSETAQTTFEELEKRDFTDGVLILCNSLNGGTGSVISPTVARWMKGYFGFASDLTVNISVFPSQMESDAEIYSRAAFDTLHSLLTDRIDGSSIVDTVVLVDNDSLAQINASGVGNFRAFNMSIRDMLIPLLLASSGRYNVPELSPTLDVADIRRRTHSPGGAGAPELSTFCFATGSISSFKSSGWFGSSRVDSERVRQQLSQLAERASSQWALDFESPPSSQNGVSVLFGPESFFRDTLELDISHLGFLTEELRRHTGIASMRAPDCFVLGDASSDVIGLTVLASGIRSKRVRQAIETAIGTEVSVRFWSSENTDAENIRAIHPDLSDQPIVGESTVTLSDE